MTGHVGRRGARGRAWRLARLPLACAVASAAASAAACGGGTGGGAAGAAADVAARGVVLREGWARAADSGATGGAYLVLENRDTATVTLQGIGTDAAEAAEVHETMVHDGVAHMMPHATLTLAPGATLTMAPGGLHLMLLRLRRPLATGDTVALVLRLGRAGAAADSLAVRVPVRGP